ncbi:MAG TPA: hypothetical protein DCM54_00195 [Gammaproteobacteria bacterium]|nr:hypothetical protein [Gammaproteobacteria bacterium]|tara:strand:- start:645 stop:1529 length:885 start_codon:yes stop_codon:yes gene_type:complete
MIPTLIRREFWEHRNTFYPYVIVGLVVLAMLAIFSMGKANVSVNHPGESSRPDVQFLQYGVDLFRDMSLEDRRDVMGTAYLFIAAEFGLMLIFVVFFYLLDSLYRDRKDRSILFWKSLPVSDLQTVGIKLFTGIVCVPVVYFLFIVCTQFLFLLAASVAALGYDASVWRTLWEPSVVVFDQWADIWIYYVIVLLWQLPLYCWLVFVSSFARSVPFIWVFGVPLAVVTVETMFGEAAISTWIGHHVVPQIGKMDLTGSVVDIGARIASVDFLITLIVSGLLLYGAVWFRGKADEM